MPSEWAQDVEDDIITPLAQHEEVGITTPTS